MAKISFYCFYLLCLGGVLMHMGHAKPIEYSSRPTCTTTIVSIAATERPPTATVYDSIVTVTSLVKCLGCALTIAPVVIEPVAECPNFDAVITSSASTVLSYICEAQYTGSAVPTGANPTANDFTTISSPSPVTLPTPPTTTNPTSNDFITPTTTAPIILPTSATCYTLTGPISSTPAGTVDGSGNLVPSGTSGIIVGDSCPQTKEEVAQCPLLCFAKSFGPNTPQFQCAKFFDDVRFHSCSPCLPPCDTPVTSVSATASSRTTGVQSYY